jgi:hypothetical protein
VAGSVKAPRWDVRDRGVHGPKWSGLIQFEPSHVAANTITIARRLNTCGAFNMQPRRLLCRRQCSEYLASRHGLDIPPEQLARWAVKGGGPPFRLLAGKVAKAVYSTLDLDEWASDYLGPLVARVAEHPAYLGAHA